MMKKDLEDFIEDNLPVFAGTTDTLEDRIDVWNYDGDVLLFSIIDKGEGNYTLLTWHENNREAKREIPYIQPTEQELVNAILVVLPEEEKVGLE